MYDEGSGMLRGFWLALAAHLEPGGEGWLILSDLAEHLQLRTREQLLEWIAQGGLKVLGRQDVKPRHGKSADASMPVRRAQRKSHRCGAWPGLIWWRFSRRQGHVLGLLAGKSCFHALANGLGPGARQLSHFLQQRFAHVQPSRSRMRAERQKMLRPCGSRGQTGVRRCRTGTCAHPPAIAGGPGSGGVTVLGEAEG